jgi:hypothetical protein
MQQFDGFLLYRLVFRANLLERYGVSIGRIMRDCKAAVMLRKCNFCTPEVKWGEIKCQQIIPNCCNNVIIRETATAPDT